MPDLDSLREFFPEEEAQAMAKNMERSMGKAYLYGGKTAMKDLGVKGTFKAVDEASLMFFRNYSLILSTKETAATIDNMKSIIFTGLKEGKDIDTIARGLRTTGLSPYTKIIPKTEAELRKIVRYRSRMIARTEALRASNMGRMYSYKAHGVKKVRWMVGPKPCPECADLEGRIFPIDDAPVPPLHPNCGCTTPSVIEVPKGDAKKGLNINESRVREYHEGLWNKTKVSNKEHMIFFNKKESGVIRGTSARVGGSEYRKNWRIFNKGPFGTIHTHTTPSPPSPDDFSVFLFSKNEKYMGIRDRNFFYELIKTEKTRSSPLIADKAKKFYRDLKPFWYGQALKASRATAKEFELVYRIKEVGY